MAHSGLCSRGALYAAAAYAFWGVATLFWDIFAGVAPVDLLACRIVSTFVLLTVVHSARGTWRELAELATHRVEMARTTARAVFISVNWCLYLWAVTSGQFLAASLGYFIAPLVTVVLGVAAMRERLRRAQWAAVLSAAAGVGRIAVDAGSLPWLSLCLAATFGFYGLTRKRSEAGVVAGLSMEVCLMTPVALAVLAARWNELDFSTIDSAVIVIGLTSAGAVTATPLLLFAAAARSADLSIVGFTQYISPTIIFLLGVFVFDEPSTGGQLQGFALIWAALALFAADGVRAVRYQRALPQRSDPKHPEHDPESRHRQRQR